MSGAWTAEEVYDAEIAPLVARVASLCREHGIPMVAVLQYCAHYDGRAGYGTTIVPTERHSEHICNMAAAAEEILPVEVLAEATVTNGNGRVH